MSSGKKRITIKIRPNNQFGRILNLTCRYFAIFGGLFHRFLSLKSNHLKKRLAFLYANEPLLINLLTTPYSA